MLQLQICLCGDPQLVRGQAPPAVRHEKFINLTSLNFCSTWFSIEIVREVIDEQNDQAVALTGCRELELIFFGLKNNLKELHLGQWAYNDILIYIAELCKDIEILELNSRQITDPSICEAMKKMEHLKVLDVAGCPMFSGQAFENAEEHLVCTKLQRLVVGMKVGIILAKEKLVPKIPKLQSELNVKKKYDLPDEDY